jgi:hypothetical protein
MATVPLPWFGAMDYFWEYDNTGKAKYFSSQCRLMFFLLGNATIKDILTTDFDIIVDVWFRTNLNLAPTAKDKTDGDHLVSVDKRKEILDGLGAKGKKGLYAKLKKRKDERYYNLEAMLKKPITRPDDEVSGRDKPDPDKHPKAYLKLRGFILPFEHADDGLDVEKATDLLLEHAGHLRLRELLTHENLGQIKWVLSLGKEVGILRPSFETGEVPTDLHPPGFEVGPNGKCCCNGVCTNIGAGPADYCQPTDTSDPNSPCNSLSDTCTGQCG